MARTLPSASATPVNNTVSETTSITLRFIPTLGFSVQDTIQVVFPSEIPVSSSANSPASSFTAMNFTRNGQTYVLSNFTNSQDVIFSTQVTLFFFMITNPTSLAPFSPISLTLLRSGRAYYRASLTYSLAMGSATAALASVATPTVGSVTSASLTFTPSHPIPANGIICLKYPDSMTVADRAATSCGAGSCSTVANTLCVSGLLASGWSGSPTSLTVPLSGLQMPSTIQPQTLTVQSRTQSNSAIDQASLTLTATIGTAQLTVTSSSSTVFSASTFTLVVTGSLPYTAVKVALPSVLTFATGQPTCYRSANTNILCSLDTSVTPNLLQFDLSETTGELTLSFTATTPPSFKPMSLAITTFSNNFAVQASSNIFVAMSSSASFSSTQGPTRSSSTNSATSSYTFTVTVPAFAPSPGSIDLTFPTGITPKASTCSLNDATVNCVLTGQTIRFPVGSVPANRSFSLLVQSVENAPAQAATSSFGVVFLAENY